MREIWHLPSNMDVHVDPSSWFKEVLKNIPANMSESFILVAWRAWYARNEATHSKPLPSVEGSKRFLCSYVKLFHDVKKLSTDDILKGKSVMVADQTVAGSALLRKTSEKRWQLPSPGWVKLNFDGSVKIDDGSAGTGMILRDEEGSIIFSACRRLVNCSDPLEAEARACEEGLKLALELSDKQIIMESDCAGLVTAVLERGQDRSSLVQTISEIKFLLKGTRLISFVKVDRSQNRVSHCLANLARAESRSMVWLGSGPESIRQALDLDLLVNPPV
jgi:ribonuclease HI